MADSRTFAFCGVKLLDKLITKIKKSDHDAQEIHTFFEDKDVNVDFNNLTDMYHQKKISGKFIK